MFQRNSVVAGAVLVAGLVAVTALAAADEEKKVRVRKVFVNEDGEAHEVSGDDHVWIDADGDHANVRIKKIVRDCDGEDCDEVHGMKIFVDENGEVTELGGMDFEWVGDHHMGGLHAGGGFLGVQLTELTAELRAHFGVPEDAGVLVAKVVDDSPAMRAGIEVGDVITGLDGEGIASGRALAGAVSSREAGDTVTIETWRAGKVQTLSAVVEEHPQRGARRMHKIVIDCDEGEDCEQNAFSFHHGGDFDCEDDECDVRVECGDDGCTCTVNGEEQECEGLHSGHGSGE